MSPRPGRRFINYPTGRLLAVFDRRDDAAAARDALQADGFSPDAIDMLAGDEGVRRLDGMGASGPLARALRAVQFTTMDQMPDFVRYEAAMRSGATVVSVRPASDVARAAAINTLTDRGAHFINWFGRLSTEEISPWRGPEPPIPGFLRR